MPGVPHFLLAGCLRPETLPPAVHSERVCASELRVSAFGDNCAAPVSLRAASPDVPLRAAGPPAAARRSALTLLSFVRPVSGFSVCLSVHAWDSPGSSCWDVVEVLASADVYVLLDLESF